jgi:hypothetical protein
VRAEKICLLHKGLKSCGSNVLRNVFRFHDALRRHLVAMRFSVEENGPLCRGAGSTARVRVAMGFNLPKQPFFVQSGQQVSKNAIRGKRRVSIALRPQFRDRTRTANGDPAQPQMRVFATSLVALCSKPLTHATSSHRTPKILSCLSFEISSPAYFEIAKGIGDSQACHMVTLYYKYRKTCAQAASCHAAVGGCAFGVTASGATLWTSWVVDGGMAGILNHKPRY